MSLVVDWLLSQGLVAILGFATKAITDYLASKQHDADTAERAKLEEHNRQLEEAVRVQHQMAEEAAKRVSEEDALKRLEEGLA